MSTVVMAALLLSASGAGLVNGKPFVVDALDEGMRMLSDPKTPVPCQSLILDAAATCKILHDGVPLLRLPDGPELDQAQSVARRLCGVWLDLSMNSAFCEGRLPIKGGSPRTVAPKRR